MQLKNIDQISLFALICCSIISLFGKNLKYEQSISGIGEYWYVDLLVFINQNFVKYIWGWTMCIITPFAIVFSIKIQTVNQYNFQVKSSNKINYLKVIQPLVRINVFGSIIWIIFTKLKSLIYKNTGRCIFENTKKIILLATTPKDCNWYGDNQAFWSGINISGHSFMLNLCSMIVLSELEMYYKIFYSNYFRDTVKKHFYKNYKKLGYFLSVWYYICVAFLVCCQSMVVLTYLIYHNYFEKVSGTLLALFAWQLIYKDISKNCKKYLPFLINSPDEQLIPRRAM